MFGTRIGPLAAFTAIVLLAVAAAASWIAYQSCTLLVADVIGAPAMGCGSTEYGFIAVAIVAVFAAAGVVWLSRRRATRR